MLLVWDKTYKNFCRVWQSVKYNLELSSDPLVIAKYFQKNRSEMNKILIAGNPVLGLYLNLKELAPEYFKSEGLIEIAYVCFLMFPLEALNRRKDIVLDWKSIMTTLMDLNSHYLLPFQNYTENPLGPIQEFDEILKALC